MDFIQYKLLVGKECNRRTFDKGWVEVSITLANLEIAARRGRKMFFKGKNVTTFLFMLLAVISLTSCSQTDSKLSAEEQALIWSRPQEKGFATYEMENVSEEEAKMLLEEELQLTLSDSFKGALELLKEQLVLDDQLLDSTQFSVFSSTKEANYGEFFLFKTTEGYYPISAQLETRYTFDKEKKVVQLSRESVVVKNVDSTETFNGKDYKQLLSKLAAIYGVSEKDFSMKLSELGQKKDETIYLYDTLETAKEEEGLGRRIYVKFSFNGVIEKIGAVMEDFSK